MQRSIPSKVLSLLLTALLCLSVFAAVEITIPKAYAATFGDYEVNFATGGTTATVNGITANTTIETPWSNPEKIRFSTALSGTPTESGFVEFTLYGDQEYGGHVYITAGTYVKEGEQFDYTIKNSPINLWHSGSISNLTLSLDFYPRDVYVMTPPARQTVNGVSFALWQGAEEEWYDPSYSFYMGVDDYEYMYMGVAGTAQSAGSYTITISTVKGNYNKTFTSVVFPAGELGAETNNWWELFDEWVATVWSHENFPMPAQDVDDIVFTVTFNPSGSGGGGSSGGGSNNSGGSTQPSTPTRAPVNSTQAVKNVKDAIAAAKNSPNGASVNLQNVTTVSLSTLKEMAKAAGNTPLAVNADSLNPDGTIDVRITIDPSKATTALNLSASTTSIAAQVAQNKFAKHFNNTVSAVSLSQKGSFGTPVRVAAKVDTKLNLDTLVFYSFDSATNTFTKIENPQYKVDKNGYVHFTTSVGGDIIISDKQLTPKK